MAKTKIISSVFLNLLITHLQENIQLNNFTLTSEELDALAQLDKKHSIILDLHDINEVYRLHNIRNLFNNR